ncbi:hypothetical protein WJX84_003903 [Apatococcus fuscideae]|uniref:Uncharacterized protein n=1 Tax=Apatococcus fuscideae TaxID=2026836 RepID=A0AAW1SPV6_9CHLO
MTVSPGTLRSFEASSSAAMAITSTFTKVVSGLLLLGLIVFAYAAGAHFGGQTGSSSSTLLSRRMLAAAPSGAKYPGPAPAPGPSSKAPASAPTASGKRH